MPRTNIFCYLHFSGANWSKRDKITYEPIRETDCDLFV